MFLTSLVARPPTIIVGRWVRNVPRILGDDAAQLRKLLYKCSREADHIGTPAIHLEEQRVARNIGAEELHRPSTQLKSVGNYPQSEGMRISGDAGKKRFPAVRYREVRADEKLTEKGLRQRTRQVFLCYRDLIFLPEPANIIQRRLKQPCRDVQVARALELRTLDQCSGRADVSLD